MTVVTPEAPPHRRKAAVIFVLITLAIDSIGIGLVVPIVPALVQHLTGAGASVAALAMGPLVATFAFAQLVAAPILGGLSDRFGRRPVLLGSLAGLGVNYVLLMFAPNLAWLFAGRVVAGATSANFSTASAYIADVSTPEERAKRFGLIGAAFSLGFVIGPAAGGILGAIDLRLPFAVAAALSAANVLYGVFVLPESLPRERRQSFSWRAANPVGAFRLLLGDSVLRHVALAWFSLLFGLNVLQTVFVLANGVRFGWGTVENGAALGLVGIASALVQTLLVRRVVTRLGEPGAATLGFCCSAVAYLMMGFAEAGWQIYAAVLVQAVGGLANPTVRSIASAQAGPDRQGRVMGALSAVEGVTAIISPLVIAGVFSVVAGPGAIVDFAGLPFVMAAIVYVVGALAIRKAIR